MFNLNKNSPYIPVAKVGRSGLWGESWTFYNVLRGGFIGGVRTPVGLVQQGCNGAAKNQIQKCGIISKVFPFLKSN